MAIIQDVALSTINLADKALIADVQFYEQYSSAALNRKFYGLIKPGVFYKSFSVSPGYGLAVLVKSKNQASAAVVNVNDNYVITVRQKSDIKVSLVEGIKNTICLIANYEIGQKTDQIDANSNTVAAQVVCVPFGAEPSNSIILADIDIPSGVTAITSAMVDYSRRQYGSIGDYILQTQISQNYQDESQETVPSSFALNQLKRLVEQVDAKTVKYWDYIARGGETELTMNIDALNIDNLFINGVRQKAVSAYVYTKDSRLINLAEPLEKDDQVCAVCGAVSQDMYDIINEMQASIKILEDALANGNIGGGNKLLQVYNAEINAHSDAVVLPINIKNIHLVFIDGALQIENLSYAFSNNLLRFTETIDQHSFLTVMYS